MTARERMLWSFEPLTCPACGHEWNHDTYRGEPVPPTTRCPACDRQWAFEYDYATDTGPTIDLVQLSPY